MIATILLALQIAAAPVAATLHAGDVVPLATVGDISSKTARPGDLVALTVTADVSAGGRVVIPRGTPATGQVDEVQTKGAFGQGGKLSLRALYLTIGDRTIRFDGRTASHGRASAGAVIGLAMITPGFTGHSAVLPAGTTLDAAVLRETAF